MPFGQTRASLRLFLALPRRKPGKFFTLAEDGSLNFPFGVKQFTSNPHARQAVGALRLLIRGCSFRKREDSVTSKIPDGIFSRPRLAIFAFASQNKNTAPPFSSSRAPSSWR
ncbi:MAG: hypothetical protein WAP52_01010, partial [Candidatus Sungiibacteriota bacterium]